MPAGFRGERKTAVGGLQGFSIRSSSDGRVVGPVLSIAAIGARSLHALSTCRHRIWWTTGWLARYVSLQNTGNHIDCESDNDHVDEENHDAVPLGVTGLVACESSVFFNGAMPILILG